MLDKNIFLILEFEKIVDHLAQFTISSLGKELVLQIQPLVDLTLINKQLSEVTELRDILDFDDPFPFSGLQDINSSLKKAQIEGNFLLPDEFYRILQTLEVARKINDYFRDRKEKYPLLLQIINHIFSFKTIEKEITRCIDVSNFEIFDNASPNLNRIRRLIGIHEQRIRKRLEEMVTDLSRKGFLQENLVVVRDGRLVLMVKDEHRNKVKGLIHDQSSTGSTLFIEPFETLELSNQVRSFKLEERREIEKILKYLTGLIREKLPEIQQTVQALAQLDFIYAKARFSQEVDGYQPAINQNNRLEIIKGKHPLLVLRHDASRPVVPLDLTIGEKFNTLVISGPNAGGKTVALKTVGLLSLMTSCGLHIPADPSSDIAIFKNIFAAIGDQQSIENDLSTFSSHIAKLREIIEQASFSDLVLIDEIGSGTDPDEGAALAIALLEKFTLIGCVTIVSTHQGALKVFAHETEGVENGSMEFNRETLVPTYHFQLGIPGSSYAYEIAKRWGLAEEITDRARELVGSKKDKFENLLEDLENRMQEYRAISNELSIKQTQLNGLIKLYQQKSEELIKGERELKQNAIEESNQILQQANKAIEQAIKQIKEQQASREAIRAAHQLIKQEKEKLRKEQERIIRKKKEISSTKKPLEQVTLGQEVFWIPYQSNGIVLSEPDAANKVLIQAGEVKVKVPLNELTYADKSTTESEVTRFRTNFQKLNSNEIDVRGLRVDEAIIAVDKFLDEAILSGLDQVYIIHGKGTGALRKAVHEFLDKHLRVKTKEFPQWSLGDTGMTVVELK